MAATPPRGYPHASGGVEVAVSETDIVGHPFRPVGGAFLAPKRKAGRSQPSGLRSVGREPCERPAWVVEVEVLQPRPAYTDTARTGQTVHSTVHIVHPMYCIVP